MHLVGYLFLVIALAASAYGILERMKNKRVLETPFRRTGEIAANRRAADAEGNVSCEGPVRYKEPTYAPCSGQPCLYYEIEIIQGWSRLTTSDGNVKEERGQSTLDTVKSGVVFFVDDGSGPVAVDPRDGLDVELERSFEMEQPVGSGDVFFNGFHVNVPEPRDGRDGESVKVIERIVPIEGRMFVLGQLDEDNTITRPKGLTGPLIASRRGRTDLMQRTKRHATIGLVAGAVFMCPGLALAGFSESPPDAAFARPSCLIMDPPADGTPCTGKILGDYGSDVTLTVTQPGSFLVTGTPPRGKKSPFIAALDVKDASGRLLVANATGSTKVDLAPGTYFINVRDSIPGAARSVKGGFAYELAVKRVELATAAPSAPPPVALAPEPPTTPPAKKAVAVKAPKNKKKAKR